MSKINKYSCQNCGGVKTYAAKLCAKCTHPTMHLSSDFDYCLCGNTKNKKGKVCKKCFYKENNKQL